MTVHIRMQGGRLVSVGHLRPGGTVLNPHSRRYVFLVCPPYIVCQPCLSVRPSVRTFVCLSFLSVRRNVCVPVCVSVGPSVCLYVCRIQGGRCRRTPPPLKIAKVMCFIALEYIFLGHKLQIFFACSARVCLWVAFLFFVVFSVHFHKKTSMPAFCFHSLRSYGIAYAVR